MVRGLVNVLADVAEDISDLVLFFDVLEESGGEGTVKAFAIGGGFAGLGGVGHDHTARLFNLCQSVAERQCAGLSDRASQLFGEGVVAAGIENEDAQAFDGLQIGDDLIDADQAPEIGFVFENRVDRAR